MTVIPFGPRPVRQGPPANAEPQSHRDMDPWPRPTLTIPPAPRPRPSLTLVR